MKIEIILGKKGNMVTTIKPEAVVGDLTIMLREKRIGAVIVSADDETVEGIVSERDVVHHLAEVGAKLLEKQVASIMTRNVVTCSPGHSIEEAMQMMSSRRIRHLPVTQDGKLAGVVSIGDLVKNRLDLIQMEAAAMRDYIAAG